MAGSVHVRLTPAALREEPDAPLEWLLGGAGEARSRQLRATAVEAASRVGSSRLVLLAPSEAVLLAEVALPGRNRQRLLQALPYAMEEQLIDDVEDMHFVLGQLAADGRYHAAAVNRARLGAWLAAAQEGGVHVDAVVPDVLVLPFAPDTWTAFLEPGRVLVRTGLHSGFAATPETAPVLLEHALTDAAEHAPAVIRVYDAAGSGGDYLRPVPSEPPLETLPYGNGLLGLAAEHGTSAALNLLQGEFSPRARLRRRLRPWYPSAALAGALLLLQPAVFAYEHWQAAQRSQALQEAIEATYRQAFPDAQRVVNARAQMESRLNDLRSRAGGAGSGFIDMLGAAGPLLGADGVEITSLRYRRGELDVELLAADFQRLERLKDQLSEAAQWGIEIQSATSRDDQVQGRLLIRGEG